MSRFVIVHTAGKVGSSSLYQSISTALPAGIVVFQSHFLSLAPLMSRLRRGDPNPALEGFLTLALSIREQMQRNPQAQRIWISMVRDPIAREVSNIVQNPWLIGCDSEAALSTSHLGAAIRHLCAPGTYEYVSGWFDREFLPAAGVNVFRFPFDARAGVGVFEVEREQATDKLILLQIEALNRLDPAWWEEHLGFRFALERSNELASRALAAQQFSRSLRVAFRPSPGLLDHVYGSRQMMHFYDIHQRRALRAAWE